MNQNEKLIELGEKIWTHRKAHGFSKKVSPEIQIEAAKLCDEGLTAYAIGKVLGVPRNTITDWWNRYKNTNPQFSEVSVVENLKSSFEVKLSTTIQNVKVELVGSDYAQLVRLVRKMS
jgi:hypothetical protein